jgi:drug/metabolite transporter (DMT)-like permease
MTWIFFTVMAAFMQAWRNAFQKQLSTTVDAYGVTLARFVGATPLAAVYLWLLYHFQPVTTAFNISEFGARFWIYIAIVAVSQIMATVLMVKLFQQKNYAIGVGLAKSEAILAALIGVAVLGVHLSLLGWLGVLIGAVAVFLLSGARSIGTLSWPIIWTGLGSGLCFAIASLMVREASLELTELPFLHRAGWVLLSAITLQNLLLLSWLAIKSPKTLTAMKARKGLTARVSIASFLGSLGWFSAMSLQSVPLVKTLGQIEVLFTLLISLLFFKEKLVKTDHVGLWLVMLGAVLVVWA